jgi:hypothetical protein
MKEATMPNTVKTFVQLIGDVIAINGPEVTVQTKNVRNDQAYYDDHPVLVADEKVLKKIKVGKKLGFAGIIRRIADRTKLILDPDHYSVNQTELKDRYLNKAGIEGFVTFKSYFGDDPNKRAMLTLGIGEPNTTGTAIYGSLWRDLATHWNTLLTGKNAVVRVVGYMRSRLMTGANAGQTMYEIIANRELSKIVNAVQITTGFDQFDDKKADALMALEFDVPQEATGNAEDGLDDHMNPNPADDNIPF